MGKWFFYIFGNDSNGLCLSWLWSTSGNNTLKTCVLCCWRISIIWKVRFVVSGQWFCCAASLPGRLLTYLLIENKLMVMLCFMFWNFNFGCGCCDILGKSAKLYLHQWFCKLVRSRNILVVLILREKFHQIWLMIIFVNDGILPFLSLILYMLNVSWKSFQGGTASPTPKSSRISMFCVLT